MASQKTNRPATKNLIFGTSASTKGAFYHSMKLQKSTDPNANRAEIILALQRTSWFERLWYPTFFIAGILCLIFIKPFNFELCFAVLSLWLYMVANNLLARGKFIGIILSIISASLYTVVSFFAKVYGEVIINVLLYIPLDIIAVITFKKNTNKKTDELDVKKLSVKGLIITMLLLIASTAGVWALLYILPGQVYPLLNAISMCAFLCALFLRNLRYIEFWWFNLIGNAVTIAMWALVSTSSLEMLYSLPFTLSSLAALLNNIYGIIMWQNLYKKVTTNGGVYVKKQVKINQVIKLKRRYEKALKWNKNIEEKHKHELEEKIYKERGEVVTNSEFLTNIRNKDDNNKNGN